MVPHKGSIVEYDLDVYNTDFVIIFQEWTQITMKY
jgi:hypothetical protein